MLKRKFSLLLLLFLALPVAKVKAQIVPDETLGEESSVVSPVNESNDNIEGGAARGDNLFHSFREFNVGEGRGVDFVNPAGIENILTRVTGGNVSNILGRLGVLGEANLFLINPNGILFGEGASLDIGGSFYGSTADSILFPNDVEFSATNPQESLLTINRPIGLVLGNNPGDIINRSFVQNSTGTDFFGLEVTPGETLTLVGGDINFEAGAVASPGGRIELGGLSETGTVSIEENGSLSFPEGIERADVSLTNAAEVNVAAGGGGSITINARNLELSEGEFGRSSLRAGIATDLGSATAQAGDIIINATDTITVDRGSEIFNQIAPGAEGNSGGIEITTTDLSLTNGGAIIASTRGIGNAGLISITAKGIISVDGEVSQGVFSGIFSQVALGAEGNSGGIEITTTDLSLTNGGAIIASTRGIGDAGLISIIAKGIISVDGESSQRFPNGIFSQVSLGAEGNSGGIEITTTDLILTNGGTISANTFGIGNAGLISITAEGIISADGESFQGFLSNINSEVAPEAEGNSEGIEITTTDLILTNGGAISASILGIGDTGLISIIAEGIISADGEDSEGFPSRIINQVAAGAEGNSGGIEITTTDLSLTNGGAVSASTLGIGDAGLISIIAKGIISVDGESSQGFLSNINSEVAPEAEGNSGGIEITTTDLILTNGGTISANTFGIGNAGLISITAEGIISADGESFQGVRSGINSEVALGAEGNSEGIEITTTDLILTNGGAISASTFGIGNTGLISITAEGIISADGEDSQGVFSGIFSRVAPGAEGNSGGIEITTTDLILTNGGTVSASTRGGDAGLVSITAKGIISADGEDSEGFSSGIFSQVAPGAEGNSKGIEITTTDLILTNGGRVSASTEERGNAGDIKIDTSNLIIDGDSSIATLTDSIGNSGTITITAPQTVSILNGSELTVETNGAGKPGNIFIATPNLTIGKDAQISATATSTSTNNEGGGSITINASNLDLTGQLGIFAETEGEAPAGTLTIQPYLDRGELNIEFTDTALISTLTEASGAGGNINLTALETINISGEGKITVETSGSGNAGSINITTENSNISDRTQISASTSGTGEAGDITINAANLSLTESVELFTNTSSSTQAGNIQLNITDSINLSNSSIEAGTTENSTGDSGSISITPTSTITIQDGAEIAVNSLGSGRGGDLTLQAGSLNLDGGSINATTTSNQGGNIDLILEDVLILRDDSQITATAGTAQAGGDGGNLTIDSNFIIAFPTANNYEISAEAFTGNGGNITIDTNSILGRDNVEINASSNFGIDGTIAINDPDVDPTSGIIELPTVPIDAEAILAQDLCRFEDEKIAKGSSFVITGRGGLTPTSEDALGNVDNVVGWANREDIEVSQNGAVGVRQRSKAETVTTNYPVVQQSQGWVKTADGNVWLVANAPETIPQNAKLVHPDCGTSP